MKMAKSLRKKKQVIGFQSTSLVSQKRGQTGTEYLIIVGFITFAVMAIIAIAFTISNSTKDKLLMNQLESFMEQLINSAESVFFSGEPSKTTISLFLPKGVTNITVYSDYILVKINLNSGENIRVFDSRVPLSGTVPVGEGTKRLAITATENYVNIVKAN